MTKIKTWRKLADKEVWTPELMYVHRTRLVYGFMFGFGIAWSIFS